VREIGMVGVKRWICEKCGKIMCAVESRIAMTAKIQASRKSRRRVGWICPAPGCDNIVRTWFPESD